MVECDDGDADVEGAEGVGKELPLVAGQAAAEAGEGLAEGLPGGVAGLDPVALEGQLGQLVLLAEGDEGVGAVVATADGSLLEQGVGRGGDADEAALEWAGPWLAQVREQLDVIT